MGTDNRASCFYFIVSIPIFSKNRLIASSNYMAETGYMSHLSFIVETIYLIVMFGDQGTVP